MTKLDNKISDLVDISPSMVYKVRKSQRIPGFKMMLKIEQITNWSINDQATARRNGLYGLAFETAFTNFINRYEDNNAITTTTTGA